MGPDAFRKQVQELQDRVQRIRARSKKTAARPGLAEEAIHELSNALEELRVSNEELQNQHEALVLAQDQHEKERQRYRDLFESAPEAYLVTDRRGNVIEANAVAERLLGVRVSSLLHTPLALRVAPSGLAPVMESIGSAPMAAQEMEADMRRRGEPNFPAALTMTAIRGADGAVVGHRWLIRDLSATKELEQRLLQSQALLRSLEEGTRDFAIFQLDAQGRIATWNHGAERVLGYSAREAIGRPFGGLRDPEDRSLSEDDLRSSAEKGGRAEVECRLVHKNGSRLWVHSVLSALRDWRGRPKGFVRFVRNVTERRDAEAALEVQRRVLALEADMGTALSESADPHVLMRRGAQAVVRHLGAALVTIWTSDESRSGYRLELSVGQEDGPDTGPDLPAMHDAEVERIGRERRAHVTSDLLVDPRFSDKTWAKRRGICFFAGYPMVLDHRVIGVLEMYARQTPGIAVKEALASTARSLALGTERQRAEARLEAALGQLELIMETVPDIIFTLDGEARLVRWNHRLETVSGLPSGSLAGRPIVELVPPDEAPFVAERIRTAWKEGHAEWEGHLQRQDGSQAPISWALAAQTDARQTAVALTGSGQDVSERRETDKRLAQLSRRLLHSREEEQRRISRELHDSTAQNLAALCMSISAARKSAVDDKRTLSVLKESEELANRCLAEVRNVSYLLHPPLLEEVGLPAALRWYVRRFSERSGVKTQLFVSDDHARLDKNLEIAVFRIVQESLTNVHRHARAQAVKVRLRQDDSTLLIEVSDNGRGMSSSVKADPSAPRASTGARKRPRGVAHDLQKLGMGLMGIRERVQEQGGRLEIESGTGGTTIRVVLPVTEEAVS